MQERQFKYSVGPKGVYEFEYSSEFNKNNQVTYKFRIASSAYGIYRFSYGIKEKPIHVEKDTQNYVSWGREIEREKIEEQFSFITRMIETIKQDKKLEILKAGQVERNEIIEMIPGTQLMAIYQNVEGTRSIKQEMQIQKYRKLERDKECKLNLNTNYTLERLSEEVDLFNFKELTRDTKKYMYYISEILAERIARALLQHKIINLCSNEKEITRSSLISIAPREKEVSEYRLNSLAYQEKQLEQEWQCLYGVADKLVGINNQILATRLNEVDLQKENNQISIIRGDKLVNEEKYKISLSKEDLKELIINLQDNYLELTSIKELSIHYFIKLIKELVEIDQVNHSLRITRKYNKAYLHKNKKLIRNSLKDTLLNQSEQGFKRVIDKHTEISDIQEKLKKVITRELERYNETQEINRDTHHSILLKGITDLLEKQIKELRQEKLENGLSRSNEEEVTIDSEYRLLSKMFNKMFWVEEEPYQVLSTRKVHILEEEVKRYVEQAALRDVDIIEGCKQVEDSPRNIDQYKENPMLQVRGRNIFKQFSKNITEKSKKEFLQSKDYILSKEILIKVKESERSLSLYKRFWVIGASSFKDWMVLPGHDFNYEEEPIQFEVEDKQNENYNVVYPNKFYKAIDRHPIAFGKELGPNEIGVSIDVLVDLINIFTMMWCKFTPAFWGWTGTQAVTGITQAIYEYMTLESSREQQSDKESKEEYDRAFNWIRWEAEQMALRARNDMNLRGNYYIGLMLEELINYMIDHHFDIMPLFRDINKMDEWRNMFDRQVDKDIKWVLDKVKGIRHKLLESERN